MNGGAYTQMYHPQPQVMMGATAANTLMPMSMYPFYYHHQQSHHPHPHHHQATMGLPAQMFPPTSAGPITAPPPIISKPPPSGNPLFPLFVLLSMIHETRGDQMSR